MQYNIDKEHAIIFSIVAWTLEQLFVLALGCYAMIYVAIQKKKIKEQNSEANNPS